MKRLTTVVWVLIGSVLISTGCSSALSREQEIALGQQNAPKFSQQGGGPIPDAAVQQYVTTLGQRMLAQLPAELKRDLPWEFQTLDSAVINAFALPGGKVFVTRALMEKMDSEAALAGVIGHEIGHVVGEHIGEQMARARNMQIGLNVLGAASESQWVGVLGGGAGKLYLLKFGRGQELEADSLGMEYMVKAGYDPAGLLTVMNVLKKAGGGGNMEMLSTHPDPDRRIEQARQALSTTYAHTQNNSNYRLGQEEYAQILARLRALPAPKHGVKK